MRKLQGAGVTGPVGLTFTLAGYSVAVLVARTFVSLIAHCTQSCPAIKIEGFHLHHFYYGIGLVMISIVALGVVQGPITRWDATLVLGIGAGLMFDEVGLVLLGVHYWDVASILPILASGAILSLALVYTLRLHGLSDFLFLNRADVLTILSVLLGVIGFLYFARPVRLYVASAAAGSWAFSAVLMGVYGRKHILRIRRGQLSVDE